MFETAFTFWIFWIGIAFIAGGILSVFQAREKFDFIMGTIIYGGLLAFLFSLFALGITIDHRTQDNYRIIEPDHVYRYETGETVVLYSYDSNHGVFISSNHGRFISADESDIVIWKSDIIDKWGDYIGKNTFELGLRNDHEYEEVLDKSSEM